jgi:hypothetical protein
MNYDKKIETVKVIVHTRTFILAIITTYNNTNCNLNQ